MVNTRTWAIIGGGVVLITCWQQLDELDFFSKKSTHQSQSPKQALRKLQPAYLGGGTKPIHSELRNITNNKALVIPKPGQSTNKARGFNQIDRNGPIPSEITYSEQDFIRLKETNSCQGCNLAGAKLDGMDLQGADLRNANLQRATFLGSNLRYSKFRNATLENAKFSNANLEQTSFMGAELNHADLQGVNAVMADFTDANLTNANMKESQLNGIHFNRAVLERTNLEGANLTFSDFNHADLSQTNFRDSDLSGALNMEWESISEQFLCGAILSDKVKFRHCH